MYYTLYLISHTSIALPDNRTGKNMKKHSEIIFYVILLILFNIIYCLIRDDFYYLICYNLVFISILLLKLKLFKSKAVKLLLIAVSIITIMVYFHTLR